MIIALKKEFQIDSTGIIGNYWRTGQVTFCYTEGALESQESIFYIKVDMTLFISMDTLLNGKSIYKMAVSVPYVFEDLTITSLVESGIDNLRDMIFNKVINNSEFFTDAVVITDDNLSEFININVT